MKVFKGQVIKTKMKDTIVVAITRRTPHKLYKKLIKKTSKFKVSAPGHTLSVGETVDIVETKPIAKGVHFKVMEAKAPAAKKVSAVKEAKK